MWNPFRRKSSAAAPSLEERAYEALRRAIERCDALKPAVDAGQLALEEVVSALRRNAFPADTIRKAIAETFGEDAAQRVS